MITLLKKIRLESKYSLRKLDALTGIKYSRISRMEQRHDRIWKGDIARLKKALTLPDEGITDKEGFARYWQ